MASQVIDLGAGAFGGDAAWQGAVLLDPSLVAGGGVGYLRHVALSGNSIRVRLAASTAADPNLPGPEFSDAFEAAAAALTFREAGGGSVVLRGPGALGNAFPDASDPYFWTPDNGDAWNAWVLGLSGGVVTLTLDDGVQIVTHDATVAPLLFGIPALAAAAELVGAIVHDAAVAPLLFGVPALTAAAELDAGVRDAVVAPIVFGVPTLDATAEILAAVAVAVAGQAITVMATSETTVAEVVGALQADAVARALVIAGLERGDDGAARVAVVAQQALAGGADGNDPGFRMRIEIANSGALLSSGLREVRDQIQRVKRVSVHETILAVGDGFSAPLGLSAGFGGFVFAPPLEAR